jgi:hypothetical protein
MSFFEAILIYYDPIFTVSAKKDGSRIVLTLRVSHTILVFYFIQVNLLQDLSVSWIDFNH